MRLFLFGFAWSMLLVSCGSGADSASAEKGVMDENGGNNEVVEERAEPAGCRVCGLCMKVHGWFYLQGVLIYTG